MAPTSGRGSVFSLPIEVSVKLHTPVVVDSLLLLLEVDGLDVVSPSLLVSEFSLVVVAAVLEDELAAVDTGD